MFNNQAFWQRIRCIATPEPDAGGGSEQKDPKLEDSENNREDTSKDFSRALAKRAAEIEAKYADYEDLKAKAAQFDELEQAKKSDLERMQEQLAATAAERDALKREQERETLVRQVAQDSGLSMEQVRLLNGDGDELKANAETMKKLLGTSGRGVPRAPKTDVPAKDDASAMQLLRDAYAV
ncbi:hypothetical protein [Bifidobacterium sp.]|uniref:hypothetical protein n=1 Tax=Bifidobacterium sp. TaxID=41200 RepID=UPI0039E7DBA0